MKKHQKGAKHPTPPKPGRYAVDTLKGSRLVEGDFPSRAAARRLALDLATVTPKDSTDELVRGYIWISLPEARA